MASKNSLNRSHRGSWREINEDVFYTAFHIYLDAIKYDPQEGFGCPKCPIELGKDEKENNFPDEIEVHISDGIVKGVPKPEKYHPKGQNILHQIG